MENHRESRKRLRPWLERMINSGDCPGLVWENRDERTFRIPWRHFNNKEWVEADSKIFREWAKYTGKYQDGDKVEYPVWKTRLRCALKKIPEIKEIPEMHRVEDANPYRVYKFVDVPCMKRNCDFDTDSNHSQASTISHPGRDILEEQLSASPPNFLLAKLNGTEKPGNVPTVVFEEDGTLPLYARPLKQIPQNFLYYQLETSGMQNFCDKLSIQPGSTHNYNIVPNMAENSLSSSEPMTTSLPSDLKSVNTDDLCLLAGLELPNSMTSITNHSMEAPPQNMSSVAVANNSIPQQYISSMHTAVFYGAPSLQVMSNTILSPGCRFFSQCSRQVNVSSMYEETLFGPKNVYQIALPSVDGYLPDSNAEQRRLITDLLEKMERGIVITCTDSDIYVQRLCRTRVFLTDGATESVQLDRKGNSLTKAFDFKKFCREFYEYQQGQRKDAPKPFFILTVGQEIKKSNYNPMGNILIYIVVKHDNATKIISQDQNANNPSSGAFYSYDSYDKFLDEFKKVATGN